MTGRVPRRYEVHLVGRDDDPMRVVTVTAYDEEHAIMRAKIRARKRWPWERLGASSVTTAAPR